MNVRLLELISTIEVYLEASCNRSDFYQSPDNRFVVFSVDEDHETYSYRREIDSEYHKSLKELKSVLKSFGLKYELSWSSTFYEDYMNTSVRQNESRTVKKILINFGLEELIPEWVIACSMGARMRLLQRHYANGTWWRKHIGRKYGERLQQLTYKAEYKKQYLVQRKKIFKAIRECARRQNKDYKIFPLDPKQIFTVDFCN